MVTTKREIWGIEIPFNSQKYKGSIQKMWNDQGIVFFYFWLPDGTGTAEFYYSMVVDYPKGLFFIWECRNAHNFPKELDEPVAKAI